MVAQRADKRVERGQVKANMRSLGPCSMLIPLLTNVRTERGFGLWSLRGPKHTEEIWTTRANAHRGDISTVRMCTYKEEED